MCRSSTAGFRTSPTAVLPPRGRPRCRQPVTGPDRLGHAVADGRDLTTGIAAAVGARRHPGVCRGDRWCVGRSTSPPTRSVRRVPGVVDGDSLAVAPAPPCWFELSPQQSYVRGPRWQRRSSTFRPRRAAPGDVDVNGDPLPIGDVRHRPRNDHVAGRRAATCRASGTVTVARPDGARSIS